jgi:glycosyltransferase involved in cell wall biosynthesis
MCYDTAMPAAQSPVSPSVAIDVTPMLGTRTGIGVAVAEIVAALRALDGGLPLVPYTLSVRARRRRHDAPPDTHFVPIPARILLRAWTRYDGPRIDRWLRPAGIIHATNYLAPPSPMPTLVSVYDCSFVRYPELCTPEVRAFEPALRRAIARGASLHTGSEFVAAEIEEIFDSRLRATGRLHVIPLGVPAVDTSSAALTIDGLPAATPFVLALGTLEPRKNLPHLVGAFARLAAAHPDVVLVIAGPDGPARADVDAAIARLAPDARARVIVTGAVSDENRRALLANARALAYPSIYEGFGFPVLEAMSAGVPVVAARAGSIPEIAGDAAILIEPTDEDELAAALERLITDDALRQQLIERGRAHIGSFSWSTTARRLDACYRELAKGAS